MDIVSRLRKFMEAENLSSSQFADMCGIPRPTVSQILNGRNKKISDELIGKIHLGFPNLSVLWLMFGEGEMKSNAKNADITPQNSTSNSDRSHLTADFKDDSGDLDLFSGVLKNPSDNFGATADPLLTGTRDEGINIDEAKPNRLPIDVAGAKKIKSIVVFYADSTFETFEPSV